MMLARVLPPLVAKEVRALLPLWIGSLAALLGLFYVSGGTAAGNGHGTGRVDALLLLVYAGASVALGALSMGHEYSARTLALLLSQPASRPRIFLVKQSVLAVMLLTLAGAVLANSPLTSIAPIVIVTLSLLGGLFVAPWFSMLSRNPLAGMVFTIAVPGVLWILVNGVFGGAFQVVAFAYGLVVVSALAFVMSWVTFLRLEAIDGPGADLRWPTRAAALAPARQRHPIWLLVKKELGLQQLTFAVAGLYFLGWALIALPGRTDVRYADLFGAMTFVFSGFLALLIGSLASAEERHLNTAEWQLLLPMRSSKQWMVKAGTALGLAMLPGVTLPAVLMFVSNGHVRIGGEYACVILLLTAVSLYVSSLSTSGVRALFLSVPVCLFVVLPILALVPRLGLIELTLPGMGLFGVALALILYFALVNHRSAERGAWRICVQLFCIAGCFAFCAALAAI